MNSSADVSEWKFNKRGIQDVSNENIFPITPRLNILPPSKGIRIALLDETAQSDTMFDHEVVMLMVMIFHSETQQSPKTSILFYRLSK